PIIFVYGHLGKTNHLVISQGLLQQLSDIELATLIAAEIGHRSTGVSLFFSVAVTLLQIPYTCYQALSRWGDRRSGILQ
ncbi:M48 family metalloprotease, partial [Planococcus sp. SIMBA_160]